MKVTWSNSLGKVGFFGLSEIQILKLTYTSYLGNVFASLTTKI